jgi:hypothetical protein
MYNVPFFGGRSTLDDMIIRGSITTMYLAICEEMKTRTLVVEHKHKKSDLDHICPNE